MNLFKAKSVAFSFDGETIYPSSSPIHNTTHDKLNTHDLLDFRYYYNANLLSVWIYDEDLIIPQLRAFERAYRKGEWKPFDIDMVRLMFISDGDIIKCGFNELGMVSIDANARMRAYHIAPPSIKNLIVDRGWKHEYFLEGERAWIMKHGNIDPALYHLIMYEE